MDILISLNKLCDQDAFLELHPKSKRPVSQDWPNQGQSAAEVMSIGNNIGLLLSSTPGLLDVYLDCPEAVALADILLPQPSANFTRGSHDSGHYLYTATTTGARKSFASTAMSTLVELRGDGAQTMISPSVHPNGSQLGFTSFNHNADAVAYDDLLKG